MDYIWSDYSENKRYLICQDNLQSGREVIDDSLDDVKVNVLGRLFDLVFPKEQINSEEKYTQLIDKYLNRAEHKDIFNLLIHFQASFDRNCGFHIQDIIAMNVEDRVNAGAFGEEIRKMYMDCDPNVRYILLDFYAQELISGGRNELFEKFIAAVYRQVNVYYQESTCTSYIYVHREKNEKNLIIIKLAKFFLCSLGRNIEVMWKGEHFPIIGTEYSMIIDNMSIV